MGKRIFTNCYCTQFLRSANTLTSVYDNALWAIGLKIDQFSLLRALERLRSATYNEIAAEVVLDKTTISRSVKVLFNVGWVDVTLDEEARYKLATLSKEATKMLRRSEPHWAVAQTRVKNEVQRFTKGSANKRLLEALESLQRVGEA
ncbi:DNA-binding MarR family transcriptional regulator [Paraburkholderia sp. GAS199]|uniref:MarR family winged helix-turn-helix transcriptional regulator n=1 Tax=Paraburkholderia sp. GAS199 TaxID=3035126 RepID=UPI003D1D81CF